MKTLNPSSLAFTSMLAKPLTTHPLIVNSGSEVSFVKRIGVTENYFAIQQPCAVE